MPERWPLIDRRYTATVTAADLVHCIDAQLDHSAVEGGDAGDRGEKIHELVKKMI